MAKMPFLLIKIEYELTKIWFNKNKLTKIN